MVRFWLKMPLDMKLGWIKGYTEGLRYAASLAEGPCVAQTNKLLGIYPHQISYAEIVNATDHFYRDSPENNPVSVTGAIQYVTLKAGGATQPQLDDFAATLRKISASEACKE